MKAPQSIRSTVILIEDDDAVREALEGLFRSVGLLVQAFESAHDFLATKVSEGPGCMVLDVRLPGKNGLDFYEDLVRSGNGRPAVFISGHADVRMSVRAMKAGAVEFLAKPVRDQELLDAVHLAIDRDRLERVEARIAATIHANFDALTERERVILALVSKGLKNKEIASSVGVSEATVKLHRGHVMQKMQAGSLADLVRMFDMVSLRTWKK